MIVMILTAILIVLMFGVCEIEGGAGIFAVGLLAYLMLTDYLSTVLNWSYNHWQYSIIVTLSYLALGVLWSFF